MENSTLLLVPINVYTIASFVSVLMVCSAAIKESSFVVTSLNSTLGIYFENIGTAQLSHQQWTILTYFNLSTMFLEIDGYNAAVDRMAQICNDEKGGVQLKQLCRPALSQMKQQLVSINNNNKILQQSDKHPREKRGLVNVVGTLTNQLFGILDQDDAQRYNNEIASLKNDEQHIYKLLKEQITITESTVNIIKKDWLAVNQQLQEIDKQTISMISMIQRNENENLTVQRFMALWIHLSIEMTNFYSIQQQIIDSITDIHHSRINTFILKPDQLRAELQQFHAVIPTDTTIFGENNMITLYQMMTAKVGQVKNALLFEIKMPLFGNKIYQVIKPIAIPTKHQELYAYIQPSSDLFLISLDRDSFYPMSEAELTSCKSIRPSEYLCMIHNVIHNVQNNQGSCEISLLMNKEAPLNECQIRFMKPRQIWIPTHDPSAWIFITERKHTINIICNKEVTTTIISGTGIITMQEACTITDGTTVIHSIETFNSRVKSVYQPTINLSSIILQSENQTTANTTNRMHHTITNILSDLDQLTTNITHLKDSVDGTSQQINYHDIHHYILLYGIIITIIGLTTACYCRKTRISSSVQPPQPLPRRFLPARVAPEDVQAHEHETIQATI